MLEVDQKCSSSFCVILLIFFLLLLELSFCAIFGHRCMFSCTCSFSVMESFLLSPQCSSKALTTPMARYESQTGSRILLVHRPQEVRAIQLEFRFHGESLEVPQLTGSEFFMLILKSDGSSPGWNLLSFSVCNFLPWKQMRRIPAHLKIKKILQYIRYWQHFGQLFERREPL